MIDIAPELYEKIKKDFEDGVNKDKQLKEIIAKIKNGTADHTDTQNYSIRIGEHSAQALTKNITTDILPDGKMYYNIAERTIVPQLEKNYELVDEAASAIQKQLNESAGIGMNPIHPQINNDRIDGLVNKITSADIFDKVAWLLDEPVKNFTQSIADDFIKGNADFQARAGLSPKVTRIVSGNCCDWCVSLAGTYNYGDEPKDFFRRHNYCRCLVLYKPVKGKVQDVYTKKVFESERSARIEKQAELKPKRDYNTLKYEHNSNGTFKVTRTVKNAVPKDLKSFEVIDVVTSKGSINRTLTDELGRRAMRIDTTDHGFPKTHPMGAHKHIILYDSNGNLIESSEKEIKELTEKDRRENSDILL